MAHRPAARSLLPMSTFCFKIKIKANLAWEIPSPLTARKLPTIPLHCYGPVLASQVSDHSS